jgi:hypothetical protein
MKKTIVSFLVLSTLVPALAAAEERTFYNAKERHERHARDVSELKSEGYADRLATDRVRAFYVVPQIGMEIATVGAEIYNPPGPGLSLTRTPSSLAAAPAYGLNLGWRIGHLNLGARYQGATFFEQGTTNPTLTLNKVYAEAGFNVHRGVMLFNGYLAGGWAFAVTNGAFVNGAGGKVGVSFDFLVNRFFSMGPGVSFDVHAYAPNGGNNWTVAYGGTLLLRLGFHI